jgi:hypothetical protein
LRRRLDAKEELLSTLQRTLQERDERLAVLEQLCNESDNTLNAIHQDLKLQNLTGLSEQHAAMGLLLESVDDPGTTHSIARVTTTLGRASSNDIAINSTSVSRFHSRIIVASDGTYLIDLQSTNGSSVNGQRTSRQRINDGDVIGIGSVKFKVIAAMVDTEIEDRSMDETHALLDDSEIFISAPRSGHAAAHLHEQERDKTKPR